MKKITLFLLMAVMVVLMTGFAPAASGTDLEAAVTPVPEPVGYLGEQEDAEGTIILANGTEQDIVSLTIKGEEDEEYSEELLEEDDPFLAGERRVLCLPAEGSYEVRLVLADETELTLHALSAEEIPECTILISEDGVAYVAYVDEDGEDADTLETETAIYEEAQRIAEEEAEAARKAEEEAAAAAAAAAAAQQSNNSNYGGDSGCLTGGLLW